jgi:cysteinyl-tRNA synthetase
VALKGENKAEAEPDATLKQEFEKIIQAWSGSMADDLNTAAALGHINTMVRLANSILEDKKPHKIANCKTILARIREQFAIWGSILGLFEADPAVFLEEQRYIKAKRKKIDLKAINELIEERQLARKNKEFGRSDSIREQLLSLGVELRDTPKGVLWDLL